MLRLALACSSLISTAHAEPTSSDPADDVGFDSAPPAAEEDALGFDAAPRADGEDGVGFDSAPSAAPEQAAAESEPAIESTPWSARATGRFDTAAWAERMRTQPLAKARLTGDLVTSYQTTHWRFLFGIHGEHDLAYRINREDYFPSTLRDYESLVYLKESLASYSNPWFEIAVGRQIVNWGEADIVSLVDVVNPRDLREPGLADLDSLRLPVLATRLSLFRGGHRIEAMAVHEAHFGYRSPPLQPFGPFRDYIPTGGVPPSLPPLDDVEYRHARDGFGWRNQQFLLRWLYRGPSGDLGLYAASVLDQMGVISAFQAHSGASTTRLTGITDPPMFGAPRYKLDILLNHPRYTMLGHSGAMTYRSFLFKWELAAQLDRPFNVRVPLESALPDQWQRANLFGGMLGVSYTGVTNMTIAAEAGQSFFLGHNAPALYPLDASTLALRTRNTFDHERWILESAATVFGWKAEYGWLLRAQVSYAIQDAMSLGLGFITYQPTDRFGPLIGLDRHDRVFLSYRYDLQLF